MTEAVTSAADGDALSSAEQAYFESGGVKTEGLVSDAAESAPGNESPAPPKAEQSAAGKDAEGGADDTIDQDGKPKNPGQWVRHGALHAERERRKRIEAELQGEREMRVRFAERLNVFNQLALPKQAEDSEKPIEPQKDSVGYVRDLATKLAGVEGKVDEVVRSAEAQRHEAAVRDFYAADARAFIGETPDFGAAYQHLLRSRDQELAMIGLADPQARAALVAAEERDLVERSVQNKTSPAAFIYELAKARGYRNSAADAAPAPTAPGRGDRPPASEQIESIQRGQAAAKSLSNVGGSAGDTVTPEVLANMSDDEFHGLFTRLSKAKQRELLGG